MCRCSSQRLMCAMRSKKVTSHAGSNFDATPVEKSIDILTRIEGDTTVVAIDEAQFFDPEIVQIVQQLASRGIRVVVAGLDTDFRGEPFGPMPILMSIAEHVDKLHAICVLCGGPARILRGCQASPVGVGSASRSASCRPRGAIA